MKVKSQYLDFKTDMENKIDDLFSQNEIDLEEFIP